MKLLPPPPLPDFIERQLPFRRGLYTLRTGERLHLIDQGDPEAQPVLMIHGNPTWSFLWRKVIALLPSFRCVAPDLLGLGLSDRIDHHSVERHGAALADLVQGLDLRGIILVAQDWGGPFATEAARLVRTGSPGACSPTRWCRCRRTRKRACFIASPACRW